MAGWLLTVWGYQALIFPRVVSGRRPWFSGCLYGLLMYGMRDLTHQSIIFGWSWLLTGLDMLCGAAACLVLAVVHTQAYVALGGVVHNGSGKELPQ